MFRLPLRLCLMGSWCGADVLGSGDRPSLLSSASAEPAPVQHKRTHSVTAGWS